MGRGRDFRGGGKGRGYHADESDAPAAPSDRPSPRAFGGETRPDQGAAVEATVKWFNSEKGFGFAEMADGSGDTFLHIKTLQALGQDTIAPGTKLSVVVGQGQKGRQINKILAIDEGGAAKAPALTAARTESRRSAPDLSAAIDMVGTVKWFSEPKGMGFVEVDGGGKDVFVHISIVERAQLGNLAEGQRVSMRVVETEKGRQAVAIRSSE
jgi:CspA family cold shock protein